MTSINDVKSVHSICCTLDFPEAQYGIYIADNGLYCIQDLAEKGKMTVFTEDCTLAQFFEAVLRMEKEANG